MLGVTNVRGRILSVIDIRRLLEFGDMGLTNLNRAIILSTGAWSSPCWPTRSWVSTPAIPTSGRRRLPTLVGKREEYLGGVTKDRVVVLDAEKLLKSKDLLVGAN